MEDLSVEHVPPSWIYLLVLLTPWVGKTCEQNGAFGEDISLSYKDWAVKDSC